MGKASNEVDKYIAKAPESVRQKLRRVRLAIRQAAPNSVEGISYRMPCYDRGKVAWFALMKGYIGLYLRPPIIAEHKEELSKFKTTKSAIHIPLEAEVPIKLIKKLVKARIDKNALPKIKKY